MGYFITAMKDFSDKDDDEHFVRYINRWNLQKRDASIELSPPREPIVFYIEKTVPVFLRPTVEAGILEWNKAFEKIGFSNAIRVEHEEDVEAKYNIDIDPEDVNYNFFRWITSEAGFAMGPSRVDPRTGQILDADIIFDASFLNSWKQKYETLTVADAEQLLPTGPPSMNWPRLGPKPRDLSTLCALRTRDAAAHGVAAAVLMGYGEITAAANSRPNSCARDQRGRDARSRPHARPAAQLQGQHLEDARRTRRRRQVPCRRDRRQRDGLLPRQHRPTGTSSGCLHPDHRTVRLLGH